MSNIKTLFFDWNKTLSNSLFWGQFSNDKSKYHEFNAKIFQWLFKENYNLIDEWMYGRVTSEDVCKRLSKGIGLSDEILLEELAESCKNMTFVNDSILSLIKTIRSRGIKCVIATDNMDTFRRFTIPGMALDEIFDDFLISCELGVCKYDIENDAIPFFDNYLQRHGLSYSDVILLDDSKEKSGTYERLGFEILYVNKSKDLVDRLIIYAD